MRVFEILVESVKPELKVVFNKLIKVLDDNQIRYVVGGANALAAYVQRPRMTIDVDVFIYPQLKKKVDDVLSKHFKLVDNSGNFHSKFSESDVEIDVLFSGNNAESYAIQNPKQKVILGVSAKVASPEALLWLYVVSGKEQNYVDGIELLRSQPDLRIDDVKKEVDSKGLKKLNKMIRASKKTSSR